ncbi:hemolymph lipopolysaccharide-binding protein-like [Trichogramma pretiosum]|uniref:hemolymph lipopolysaccharide-binding protein-like n=1 Tax=Trichogramma pretiosum TaxID=7493 RepID=UPI0006C9967D|nr:hemolymph lipopolysaccharide-binding protein-like [Trichogramma pretiosum]
MNVKVLSFALVTAASVLLVSADDAPQKPTDPLLSSLDNITKKVQMIKARLDKTLNETKSSGLLEKGRHDTLIETGYRLTPGAGYHKLYLNEMSWHDALNFCRRKNAHLAVVNSTAELDVLGNAVKERLAPLTGEKSMAYIGMHDYNSPNVWLDVFFQIIEKQNYLRWSKPTHPRTETEAGNCVAVDEDGDMHVVACKRKLPFICEAEI